MYDIRVLFLLFLIYSIIGWFCEGISQLIYKHRFVNRGFLIGPYCPVYGVGGVLINFLVSSNNDIVSVFLKSMAICSIVEYLTSLIMEKLFKTRWWDYTNKKFNINGRICLETMILFGLGGVTAVKFANPIVLNILTSFNSVLLSILSSLFAVLFITDIIVSYKIINSFKKIPKEIRKDSTEEVTKMVRQTLKEKSYLYKRLVYSFPNFESIVKKYDKKIERQKKRIKKEKEKLKKLKKIS
jgi:uncharacterized membrane protein